MVDRKLFPEKSAKELLVQFRETGSEEPYEEIVRRYAAMVYGVCLRVTQDKHDAEDATQAVFLSLALQAKTSREITYVGPWLQKVAHRLALDVKKSKTRRKKREDKLADLARHNGNGNGNGHPGRYGDNGGHNGFFGGKAELDPADKPGADELKSIMMEELNKLPAKYRMPLVLHYFGGLSREEMAAELSCNPSTLGVRVHRGKTMLGKRLAKRGVAISAISFAVLLEHVVRTTTVHPIIASASAATLGAANGSTATGLFAGSNGFANGHSAAVAQATARVIAITRVALRSVVYAKTKFAIIGGLLLLTAIITAGTVVAQITNLHVPPMLDVRQWIQPLLQNLVPSPRVDATPPSIDVDPNADIPATPSSPPLDIRVNLDQLGLGNQAPVSPSFAANDSLSAKTQAPTAPTPNEVSNVLPAAVSSLTRTPVGPPVRLPSPVTIPPSLSIGVDAVAKAKGESSTDPTQPMLVAADAGDFSLTGAGGGGGLGKPDIYVMPAGASLQSRSMTIGDTAGGTALFIQNGGNSIVNGPLVIGKRKGSVGTYQQNAGTLNTLNEIIGGEGDGTFIELNGINVAQNSIIVGDAGHGNYTQSSGSTTVANADPTSDPTQDPNGLHIGEQSGSVGTFVLSGATSSLSADPEVIGKSGTGSLTQTGGTNTTGAIAIAAQPGSNGSYELKAGNLVITQRSTKKPTAAISIGLAGDGTFNIGAGDNTGKVYEAPGSAGAGSVVVRGNARGDGSLVGYGTFNLTGTFVNNGQVVADGHGKNRTLDLAHFAGVTSNIENPRYNGTNGWFARRKGKLVLPAIPVTAGNGTYTWGEDAGDPLIDLVNSVRFNIEGAKQDGDVSIALYSPLRDDVPTLPKGHHFIGIWSFDGSELGGFDGMDLQIRYDDAMAKDLGLDEGILKLWRYDSSVDQWIRINDASFTRDTLDHILSGHAPGDDTTFFAVSAPEPSGATLLLIGASAALLHRRRRRI